jgi:pimeloyl-ACP methyl ester carboxylesterase
MEKLTYEMYPANLAMRDEIEREARRARIEWMRQFVADAAGIFGATRQIEPFYREAGSGPGVVCTHASAGTSGQWRALMDLLAPRFRVLAPDSYGSGKSPEWPSDRVISLRDEAALIDPVLARAGSPLALVGHSYGAAVALIAALENPGRVRAMALYEPTLFALLDAETLPPNEADGIRSGVADAAAALDAGNRDAAAERFIDYWMGTGSWKRTPDERKGPIAASVTNVRRWAHALFTEPTPLAAFRSLDIPVLYMVGKRSTPSAHGVARLLTNALPRVEVVEFDELGHMGPVTHPEAVNDVIARFLGRA